MVLLSSDPGEACAVEVTLDRRNTMRESSTMSVSSADAKKRIVLPGGRPGDVFDIQQQAEGPWLLVRPEKLSCRTDEQGGVREGKARGAPATEDAVGETSRTDA